MKEIFETSKMIKFPNENYNYDKAYYTSKKMQYEMPVTTEDIATNRGNETNRILLLNKSTNRTEANY